MSTQDTLLLVISDKHRADMAANQIGSACRIIRCPSRNEAKAQMQYLSGRDPMHRPAPYKPGPPWLRVLIEAGVPATCTMQGAFMSSPRRPINSLTVADMAYNCGLAYLLCLSLPPGDEDREDLEEHCRTRTVHTFDIYVPPGPDAVALPPMRWKQACDELWKAKK